VNRKLHDRCPACDRNGLPLSANNGARRHCTLCSAEEPRRQDRVVYLACVSGVTFVDGKGAFLSGSWWVTPYLSRREAEDDLRAYVDRTTRRWAEAGRPCTTEPLTVDGHSGKALYMNSGPEFVFVREKLMDCSALLTDNRLSTEVQ